MEARFGHDFAAVRLHRDARAAESARAVAARAYTVGEDIVFASGGYAPQTTDGERLLAHELVHVVQGRRGGVAERPATLTVGSTTAPEEREATAFEGTGVQAAHGRAPAGGTRRQLRRFTSTEHVEIGKQALPGQTANIFGYGPIPIGELIALGDYFESLQQIQDVAHQGASGKAEIDCARQKVTTGGKCADATAEQAVSSRYDQLAARNASHFSTGTAGGKSNRDMYIDYHTRAIQSAWAAGYSPLTAQSAFPEALEAFGMHFLTDAFSAGHIRTPRGELRSYWNGLYPNFSNNLIEMISCYMSSYIADVDHPTFAYIPVPVSVISSQKVQPAIRTRAGSRLANYGIGDLLSIAMHDADNAGLDVVSASGPPGSAPGPYHWRAVGDSFLFASTPPATLTGATAAPAGPTVTMVLEAVKRSFAEVTNARSVGQSGGVVGPLVNPSTFAALQLIPQADPASKTNPTYDWKVPNIRALPALTRSILAAEFKPGQQIANNLAGFVLPDCEGGAHVGSAWRCFMRLLNADPFEMIARACEGTTCPPGNNNPCAAPPEPAVPATCP
jgi:hypothetical protein